MTIRRRTTTKVEEYYDSAKTNGPTGGEFLKTKKWSDEGTSAIQSGNDENTINEDDYTQDIGKPPIKGRTFADLFMDSKNDPRIISVLLLFLPIPFFASGIKKPADITTPLIIGLILIICWFIVVPAVVWIGNKLKNN